MIYVHVHADKRKVSYDEAHDKHETQRINNITQSTTRTFSIVMYSCDGYKEMHNGECR